MLERLAAENAGKVRILKVRVEANQNWAMEHQVRGVPTIQFYKRGKILHAFAGAYPQKAIQRKIDRYADAPKPKQSSSPGSIKPMPKDWLPPGVERE